MSGAAKVRVRFVYKHRVPQQRAAPEKEYNFLCSHVGQLSARREPFLPRGFLYLANAFYTTDKMHFIKSVWCYIKHARTHSISCEIYLHRAHWTMEKATPAGECWEPAPSTQTHHNIFWWSGSAQFFTSFLCWYKAAEKKSMYKNQLIACML